MPGIVGLFANPESRDSQCVDRSLMMSDAGVA